MSSRSVGARCTAFSTELAYASAFLVLAAVLGGCTGLVTSAGTAGSPPASVLAITTTSLPAAGVQSSYSAKVLVAGGTAP